MGWDITYHPFHVQEAHDIYFRCLDETEHYQNIARAFKLEEKHTEQLGDFLESIRSRHEDAEENPPGRFHIYAMAVVAGFLRPYWYVRGSAFSFLPNEILENYISNWNVLLPQHRVSGTLDHCLAENYAGGVFLAPEALRRLRSDYASNLGLRTQMDEVFSHGRLEVFWKAVDFAIENDLGLIEAAEVVEPNPLDLNASSCYSNLLNCVPDGALLYMEAAKEQLRETIGADKLEKATFGRQRIVVDGSGTIIDTTEIGSIHKPYEQVSKPGFLRRLFGIKLH